MRNLHYNNTVKGTLRGDDDYLIDMDANYVRHVKKHRFNIHCCVPCLGVRDSARETDRVAVMRTMLREKKIGEKTFKVYVRPTNYIRRCTKTTQAYGMAIHS